MRLVFGKFEWSNLLLWDILTSQLGNSFFFHGISKIGNGFQATISAGDLYPSGIKCANGQCHVPLPSEIPRVYHV